MAMLRVPSSLLALSADRPLSAAMVAVVWEIANAVTLLRLGEVARDGVWLSLPSSRLRGAGARSDNVWLVECLERLTGVKFGGERDGAPWGAVLLAEWHLVGGGSTVRVLLPPAAVAVLAAPATFAQLDAELVHRLPPNATRLYGLLGDKRRQRVPSWRVGVDELRDLLGVADRRSYRRFNTFRQFVLTPAVAAINDLCPVEVRMTPEREGRSVVAVRFDWKWRELGDAAETVAENARHSGSRRRRQAAPDAPPLVPAGLAPRDQAEFQRYLAESLPGETFETWEKRNG